MTGLYTFTVGYTEPDRDFPTLDALALYLVDRLAIQHPGLDVAAVVVRLDPMKIPGGVAVAIRLPAGDRPAKGVWAGADLGYVLMPGSKQARYADKVIDAIMAARLAREAQAGRAAA